MSLVKENTGVDEATMIPRTHPFDRAVAADNLRRNRERTPGQKSINTPRERNKMSRTYAMNQVVHDRKRRNPVVPESYPDFREVSAARFKRLAEHIGFTSSANLQKSSGKVQFDGHGDSVDNLVAFRLTTPQGVSYFVERNSNEYACESVIAEVEEGGKQVWRADHAADESNLDEKGIARIFHHLDRGNGYAILSADRHERSDAENHTHRKMLEAHLRKMGKGFTHVVGGYVENGPSGKREVKEHSYFIPNVSRKEGRSLAKHAYESHGQEAIMHGHPDHGAHLLFGASGQRQKVGDQASYHHASEYFTSYHARKFGMGPKVRRLAASIGNENVMDENEEPRWHGYSLVNGKYEGSVRAPHLQSAKRKLDRKHGKGYRKIFIDPGPEYRMPTTLTDMMRKHPDRPGLWGHPSVTSQDARKSDESSMDEENIILPPHPKDHPQLDGYLKAAKPYLTQKTRQISARKHPAGFKTRYVKRAIQDLHHNLIQSHAKHWGVFHQQLAASVGNESADEASMLGRNDPDRKWLAGQARDFRDLTSDGGLPYSRGREENPTTRKIMLRLANNKKETDRAARLKNFVRRTVKNDRVRESDEDIDPIQQAVAILSNGCADTSEAREAVEFLNSALRSMAEDEDTKDLRTEIADALVDYATGVVNEGAISGPVDDHAANELHLHVRNHQMLARQHDAIVQNMLKHHAKGRYDREKAVKGFMHVVDHASKVYRQSFGGHASQFNKNTRTEAAKRLRDDFEQEHSVGSYEHRESIEEGYSPEDYQLNAHHVLKHAGFTVKDLGTAGVLVHHPTLKFKDNMAARKNIVRVLSLKGGLLDNETFDKETHDRDGYHASIHPHHKMNIHIIPSAAEGGTHGNRIVFDSVHHESIDSLSVEESQKENNQLRQKLDIAEAALVKLQTSDEGDEGDELSESTDERATGVEQSEDGRQASSQPVRMLPAIVSESTYSKPTEGVVQIGENTPTPVATFIRMRQSAEAR